MKEQNKMLKLRAPGWPCGPALLSAALLAGCASSTRAPAPVEDRGTARGMPAVVATTPAPAQLPGAENAGKPGYYTVRPGDTLVRIGLEAGQNWRDIARWNNIDNPNLIEVGQVLRVAPPVVVAAAPAPAGPEVAARPVTAASATPSAITPTTATASAPRTVTSTATPTTAAASAPVVPPVNTQPVAPGDDNVDWAWPTPGGPVLAGFDEQKNKGLDIGGRAGDPVLAAADGRVVYAGAGLRGYGNLIILKHNNTYLTAYAHNQTLLVKEDQAVRKGQKIAEMGSSDADRVKLHFEVRRQGKPVDPARYLPAR
jgi:lipoprotein NlpD